MSTADVLFKRALTTYALARTFNGVISVAQETEIAVQPVGVGVTIGAGQILDPLNDLIERFSWLVLGASASLGLQLLATEMFAHPVVTVLVLATIGLMLCALWVPRLPARTQILKLGAMVLCVRFLFAAITLAGALLSDVFLAERQRVAMADIEQVSSALAAEETVVPTTSTDSLIERIDRFVSSSARGLDIEARLQRLGSQAETAIAALIDLISVFLMQTVVLPLALLWGASAALRGLWRNWPRH